MPKTKLEKIIFGVLMSLCMVYGMEIYNHAYLAGGLANSGFLMGIKEWIILALIVFAIENAYGGRLARTLAFRIVHPEKDRSIIVILTLQILTVCVMCPSMSLVASIMFKGALDNGVYDFFVIWIQTIAINLPMAFIWQLAVCGPIVRIINRKVVVPVEKKFNMI